MSTHALAHVVYGLVDANYFLLIHATVYGIQIAHLHGKKMTSLVSGMALVHFVAQWHVRLQVHVVFQADHA
jgi:hypothetical protein